MFTLFIYLKPFKKQCIIGPVCKLMEAILEILLPTIMAFMINEGIVKGDMQVVYQLGALMMCMVLIGFGFSITCQYQAAIASQGFGTALRNKMFQHITTFSYADIDHFTTSSLTNRLTNDINQMQLAIAMLIRLVVRSPFIVGGTIVIALFLDVQLGLILMASTPFIILILYLFIRFSTPMYLAYQKKLDHFATLLDDHLSGVRIIRAFVMQRQEKQRFDEAGSDLQKQMLRVSRLSALMNPLCSLVVNASIMFLMVSGLLQIAQDAMPPGNLIAFINYATQMLLALVAISNLIVIFTKAAASAQRIQEVLNHQPAIQYGSQCFDGTSAIAISASHLNFHYGNGEEALHDISFTIPAHASIGIIGGIGSGKSTLAHLLCRFYERTAGELELFQHPIEDYDQACLCQRITIVPQTNALFKGSIRENILFGATDVSFQQLSAAIQDAQAQAFIEDLPDGLDTLIERGGTNLSGGQRQRLCIARALLRNSDILVLDDAGSALDYRTDAQLRQALKKRDKQTFIVISQRVSSIMNSDMIMVLNDGELCGYDTHAALFETCDVYREICETQHIGRDAA